MAYHNHSRRDVHSCRGGIPGGEHSRAALCNSVCTRGVSLKKQNRREDPYWLESTSTDRWNQDYRVAIVEFCLKTAQVVNMLSVFQDNHLKSEFVSFEYLFPTSVSVTQPVQKVPHVASTWQLDVVRAVSKELRQIRKKLHRYFQGAFHLPVESRGKTTSTFSISLSAWNKTCALSGGTGITGIDRCIYQGDIRQVGAQHHGPNHRYVHETGGADLDPGRDVRAVGCNII